MTGPEAPVRRNRSRWYNPVYATGAAWSGIMENVRLRDDEGVLILRLGAVGDVIRTLPCLARLRESLPRVRIGWVVEPSAARLLPGPPWLDRTMIFPRHSFKLGQVFGSPVAVSRALSRFLSELRSFDA